MSAKNQLFSTLQKTFSRMEAKRVTHKLGRSRSWLNQVLENALFDGDLERVERGIYRQK